MTVTAASFYTKLTIISC